MRPTFAHARDRREVMLSDGRTGTLQHITRNTRVATVVMGGRRYRMPARDVSVIATHGWLVDGALVCCSRPISEIEHPDRFTTIPGQITCPRWKPERLP